ncbi:MAG: hypothetical protein JNL74_01320, partial [Fibrobacteres bacterium]|nr:hypothetical protein [Fibrobacterota bacterium]
MVVIIQGINLIQINDNVRLIILKKVAPYLNGRITIERLSIGWFKVHVSGLSINSTDESYDIKLKDLAISFFPKKLIKNRFDFTKSVSTIEIIEPQIALRLVETTQLRETVNHPQEKQVKERTVQQQPSAPAFDLRAFPVNSLTIRKGLVTVHGKKMKVLSISSIEGLLSIDSAGYSFSLNGSFMNTNKSFDIVGCANPAFTEYEFNGKLDSAVVTSPINTGNILISNGLVSASFHFHKNLSMPLQFSDITADFYADGVNAVITDSIHVNDIHAAVHIRDNTIFIDRLNAKSSGMAIISTGHISNLFNPWFMIDVALSGKPDENSPIVNMFLPDSTRAGNIFCRLNISGDPGNPAVTGNFTIIGADYKKRIAIQKLAGSIKTVHDTISIHSIYGTLQNGRINGSVQIPIKKPENTALSLQLKDAGLNDATAGKILFTQLNITRTAAANKPASLLFKGTLRSEKLDFAGNIQFSVEKNLHDMLITAGNDSASIALAGRLTSTEEGPKGRLLLTLNRARPLTSVGYDDLQNAAFSGDAHINFTGKDIRFLSTQRISSKAIKGTVYLTGGYEKEGRRITAKAVADSLDLFGTKSDLNINITQKDGSLSISKIKFGQWINGSFNIDNKNNINGSLNLTTFEFKNIVVASNESEVSSDLYLNGQLNGYVTITGTSSNPSINSSLKLVNGELGKAKNITAGLILKGDKSSFLLKNLLVETKAQKLVWSDSIRFTNGILTGQIQSGKIDLAQFWPDTTVNGTFLFKIDALRRGYSEILVIAERIRSGSLSINSLKAELLERNGVAEIRNFSFATPELSGEISGRTTLPFTSNSAEERRDTVDLLISAKGNILKELTAFTPLFKNRFNARTTGQGTLQLSLTGTSKSLNVRSGIIDISKDPTA